MGQSRWASGNRDGKFPPFSKITGGSFETTTANRRERCWIHDNMTGECRGVKTTCWWIRKNWPHSCVKWMLKLQKKNRTTTHNNVREKCKKNCTWFYVMEIVRLPAHISEFNARKIAWKRIFAGFCSRKVGLVLQKNTPNLQNKFPARRGLTVPNTAPVPITDSIDRPTSGQVSR